MAAAARHLDPGHQRLKVLADVPLEHLDPLGGSVASVISLDEQLTYQRAFEVDGIGCAPATSPSWFAAARPAAVR